MASCRVANNNSGDIAVHYRCVTGGFAYAGAAGRMPACVAIAVIIFGLQDVRAFYQLRHGK